jgi:hypothetical protein
MALVAPWLQESVVLCGIGSTPTKKRRLETCALTLLLVVGTRTTRVPSTTPGASFTGGQEEDGGRDVDGGEPLGSFWK